MRKVVNKGFFLLILLLLFSACTGKPKGLTRAVDLKITGDYEGWAYADEKFLKISLFGTPTRDLSHYKNVRPLIGGNYIPVYFDTDMQEEGAEYAAFIFADQIALKWDDGAGWYNRELKILSYRRASEGIMFDIPLKYFRYKPFMVWTEAIF
jgi:hypothetical protein